MKNLPDDVQITRRVHQGALKMVLRQAPIIKQARDEIYADIAERVNQEFGFDLTGQDLRDNYTYDPNTHSLERMGQPQQRYLLGICEYLCLEQARKLADKADTRADEVLQEVVDRLNQDYNADITLEDFKRDWQLELRPSLQTTNVVIKKKRK